MSSRHFRKMTQQNKLPLPPDDSDDDYQPLYAQRAKVSTYAGLEVSSHSESERASERSEEEALDNACAHPIGTHNKKKNLKKKGKGAGRVANAGLDEVERSVREVNAILGSPPPAPPAKPHNQALEILTVDPKHLNVAFELRRIFGPEEETQNRRARVAPNRALMLKRILIPPNKETTVFELNNSGWSMTKDKDEGDRMYFVYNHSQEYQEKHRIFLKKLFVPGNNGDRFLMDFEIARDNMHVEKLLEISDRLFVLEENSIANDIVENVITFLQSVAHPLFVLSQNNVRLDYKFLENRPFHVAMLKYVYLLSNKACHRTALEIAKMLLLLDPCDPLALVSLIDILALRCREHEWLIETVKYFDRQREALLLFNIKYSNSLAHFHVALKKKLDFAESDRLIRDAILAFPSVFLKILECSHSSKPEFIDHPIFKPDSNTAWSDQRSEVFMIYAKMTAPRWNEPAVMSWLLKNATELCNSYYTDESVKKTTKDWTITRYGLFQHWPIEYERHIYVFKSMSKLIIDVPLSTFNKATCAWDPLFHKSINRYSYTYKEVPTTEEVRRPIYSPRLVFHMAPPQLDLTSFAGFAHSVPAPIPLPYYSLSFPTGFLHDMPLERYIQTMEPIFQEPEKLCPDFPVYDYSEDLERFALNEKEDAEGIKGQDPNLNDDETDDEVSESMDNVCLDPRYRQMFNASNAA